MKIPETRQRKGSLTIDYDVARQVRKVAKAEGRGREITAMVRDLVRVYIEHEHPEWLDDERGGGK